MPEKIHSEFGNPPAEFIDRWREKLLAKGVKCDEVEFSGFVQNMWDLTRQAMRSRHFQGTWQSYLEQQDQAEEGREEEGGEMTAEEIRKMTREEAIEAFAVSLGKSSGLETEYRALKLALMRETQNPELTDEQRALLFKILVDL